MGMISVGFGYPAAMGSPIRILNGAKGISQRTSLVHCVASLDKRST